MNPPHFTFTYAMHFLLVCCLRKQFPLMAQR
uniref:Uncharacterized protein n=1 Tax=Anguilla anguilla TaxID=7936 RepID=A0A0E9V1F4_ANGAN